jgi:RNA polymerase sigma factor (sigma-70 family)
MRFLQNMKNYERRLSPQELTQHIRGCAQNNRKSQQKIYNSFYEYAMAICHLYAATHEDTVEILNDGFLKIFRQIADFSPAYTNEMACFLGWLRQIMIRTAIDHYRKNNKYNTGSAFVDEADHFPSLNENGFDRLSHKEIINAIQQLTPAYRTVLVLRIVEGYSHRQIALSLGISEGTSKSNFSKARYRMQEILLEKDGYCNYACDYAV